MALSTTSSYCRCEYIEHDLAETLTKFRQIAAEQDCWHINISEPATYGTQVCIAMDAKCYKGNRGCSCNNPRRSNLLRLLAFRESYTRMKHSLSVTIKLTSTDSRYLRFENGEYNTDTTQHVLEDRIVIPAFYKKKKVANFNEKSIRVNLYPSNKFEQIPIDLKAQAWKEYAVDPYPEQSASITVAIPPSNADVKPQTNKRGSFSVQNDPVELESPADVTQVQTELQLENTPQPYLNTVGPNPMYDYDVFISHASKDKNIIMQLIADLKSADIRYWVDHEQIEPGDRITEKIEDGLQRSKHVLVCLSRNLGRSNWCRAEYGPILNRSYNRIDGRRAIPLRLDDCPDNDIPLLLYDVSRVDYTDKDKFRELVEFLKR